jgi:O-antigen/teichoic acid export membrane protein
VSAVVSIVAFAVIARIVTREEMGELAILLLVVAGTTLLAGLGVSSSATKLVASFSAIGDHEKRSRAGYACLSVTALATIIIVIATYLSSMNLALILFGDGSKAMLLRLLTLEIAVVSIKSPLTGILVGLERFKELSLTSMITFTARQLLVVLFLTLGWGVPGMVIGWGIGDALCSLGLMAFTIRFLGCPRLGSEFLSLLKFSFPLLLGDAATYAWTWFDRALLIPMVTLSQLGAYNVAVTAFGILGSMPSAISGTLFPYYARFYPNDNASTSTEDLENAISKASRYISFFTIPLALGLAATALPAATLLAGSSYTDAAYPLAILSISLAAGCLVRALSQIFVVMGKTGTSAFVTTGSVLISVLLGIVIVPHMGIVGASLARGLSIVMAFALSIPLLKKMLRISFDKRAYRSAWTASLFMTVTVVIFQSIFYSKYLLPLYILLGALVFVLGLKMLHAVNQEDLQLLSDFSGPKLRFIVKALGKLINAETSEPN